MESQDAKTRPFCYHTPCACRGFLLRGGPWMLEVAKHMAHRKMKDLERRPGIR
jgi:hypothetical protein